ncbi:unnamed protein product [Musa acuminata subsp. malaccensis]|uniref:(wild Malaysian banana) hypothetical protein n=1 Tax=Musa acuminata subsp. malaccensis TaxID=214687 RepID=A0A804L6U6_MUSAM|nr:PREDICTED: uncharacterized protein LOC103971349 [Musa acuminata subsp. malaccensis]CAG1864304.1 unnamed protein product [Musa acuminata subsp. malaccensis]
MEECSTNPADRMPNKHSLDITLEELVRTREEIKRARESAVQSWIDSMPSIDELESSRSVLSRTRNRVTMYTTAIASLCSLLNSTGRSIRHKQAEESNSKMAAAEMRQEAHRRREEMESLKVEMEEMGASRNKVKMKLQIKSQLLKALQLKLRAIDMEMEAVNESVDATLHQAKHLRADHKMIALSHEEYNVMCRRMEEEAAAASSRIVWWDGKRCAAADRKANALQRLQALQREREIAGVMSKEAHLEAGKKTKTKASPLQGKLKETEGYYQQPRRRARRQSSEKEVRKKQSILQKTRRFIMRKLKWFFN